MAKTRHRQIKSRRKKGIRSNCKNKKRMSFGIKLGKKIGSGNQGDIYELDGFTNKYIVKIIRYLDPNSSSIKTLPKAMQKKFNIENQIKKTIEEIEIHKKAAELGIAPKILSYTKDYIIMEYVNGTTLTNYLSTHSYSSVKNDVEKAIEKLNDNGITHNDLTTDNIMIDNNGKIFIIDFGISELVEPEYYEELLFL